MTLKVSLILFEVFEIFIQGWTHHHERFLHSRYWIRGHSDYQRRYGQSQHDVGCVSFSIAARVLHSRFTHSR